MEVKEYCDNRKLEMVTESRELDRKYQGLLAQGKQLEALLNQTNELKRRLDIEDPPEGLKMNVSEFYLLRRIKHKVWEE
ncbi:hypothetical protein LCGC14_1290920, partial [marine sediment metagenome]